MPPLIRKDVYGDNSVIVSAIPYKAMPKKERRVHFSHRVKCVRVPCVSCFSIEEIKSTWYSQKEMRAIRKVAANTVRLLTDAPKVVLQRKDLCPDGLLSIREMQSRRKVIDEAQEVVLLEQEFQQLQGSYDEDLLADMYLMCTRKNQLEALERAHSHAQRIKLVLPQGN